MRGFYGSPTSDVSRELRALASIEHSHSEIATRSRRRSMRSTRVLTLPTRSTWRAVLVLADSRHSTDFWRRGPRGLALTPVALPARSHRGAASPRRQVRPARRCVGMFADAQTTRLASGSLGNEFADLTGVSAVSSTQKHRSPGFGMDLAVRGEPGDAVWPTLDYSAWRDSAATLHLWTQVVGKVRLALTPWLNHGWHVPLYVNAHGLGTSLIHAGATLLEIDFDLVNHRLIVRTSNAPDRGFALAPMSVAAFYGRLMSELGEAGIAVGIDINPNEIVAPIRFPDDETHAAYDAKAAHAFWGALVRTDRVFKQFRTAFLGKSSPVHFFWGGFDLAVTRLSGRAGGLRTRSRCA